MPETEVVFYQEGDGTVPVLDWLEGLRKKGQRRAVAKCQERIRRLAAFGYDLRRPLADILRDGATAFMSYGPNRAGSTTGYCISFTDRMRPSSSMR